MPAARAARIPVFLDRVFAPREIFFSWGDRFHYLRLSARGQKIAAAAATAAVVWSLLATAGNILDRRNLAFQEGEMARQAHARADLQRDLGQAFENRTKMTKQLEALRVALARENADRLALRGRGDAQSRRIQGLEARLARLRESEQDVMERLSVRVREGASAVEKTVAMTGLNIDDLLAGGGGLQPAALGQGGPFIPAESFNAGTRAGSELAATVSRLEAQLDRWSELRDVVRRLPLSVPLDQFRISSAYGQRRDPISGRKARHLGIDFVAPPLTPIRATAPGTVVFAGENGRYGIMVEIYHGYGIATRYAHLRKVLVRKGQEVGHRGKIGLLGSSGRSTGPHLHYEIRVKGQSRNPMKYILAGKYLFKD